MEDLKGSNNDTSMIDSSPAVDPDLHKDKLEATSLTAFTQNFSNHLSIQEDCVANKDMGIETQWSPEATMSPTDAISLPGPNNYYNSVEDNNRGVMHGPMLPENMTLTGLFSETHEVQDDAVVESNVPPGVCGLHNLGNTCFMAAGLQCLTATPPVRQHFLDLHQRSEKEPPPNSLMDNFSRLLGKMWSGRHNVLKPTEFKQSLGVYHSQFRDYRQHDCQEFLALLLDSLHEQMNTAKSAKRCRMPTTTVTAAGQAPSALENGDDDSHITDTLNTAIKSFMGYGNSLGNDCPNSPNDTVAGSPRDSPTQDLDSVANTPHNSSPNEDEETQDSEEVFDKANCQITKTLSQCDYDDDRCNNGKLIVDKESDTTDYSPPFTLYNYSPTNFEYDLEKEDKYSEICERNSQPIYQSNSLDLEESENCSVKKMRLDKDHERENNQSNANDYTRITHNWKNGAVAANEEDEADKHWSKHLSSNKSVIVDTFQGQFKSTVVCESCKHISVTYEPFMYLSVPLPHAMEKQLTVTYVPDGSRSPIKCSISLNKQAKISKLKEEVLKTLGIEDVSLSNVVLAEVFDNHISKLLDDQSPLRNMSDTNRSIYAFELPDAPDISVEMFDGSGDRVTPMETNQSNVPSDSDNLHCTICFEEDQLKKHEGKECDLRICHSCLENYFKNDGKDASPLLCPVCCSPVEITSYVNIEQQASLMRILNVPVVMRYDSKDASDVDRPTRLFDHPRLLRLPSKISFADLQSAVQSIIPGGFSYSLKYVSGEGLSCAKCIYTTHCQGCEISSESSEVIFKQNDTLAIHYTENIPAMIPMREHSSYKDQIPHQSLTLNDCLQAFSQSEKLDVHNPWFCPKCEKNQCATKTLTVHRYPKFLIVYLKRFVFYDCVGVKLDNKVSFPLVGLRVGCHNYDLYACVCHYGCVTAGHYTAYAKNPETNMWHYYNDDQTKQQKPQDDDFSNAYILFYCRQETNKLCNI